MDLYTHEETKDLVFVATYDNNYDILKSFQTNFRIGKVVQQFEKKIHDPLHHFTVIQGTDCIEFFTLWEGVCTNIFSFSDYVCISEYDISKKHSNNSPLSSYDDL